VFVQPSHGFKPPAHGDTPMIMVGPDGHRAVPRVSRRAPGARAKGKQLALLRRSEARDGLSLRGFAGGLEKGWLSQRLDLAFSRDQADKIYVQTRMLKRRRSCGHGSRGRAFLRVRRCIAHGERRGCRSACDHRKGRRKSTDEAKAYVAKLKTDKRYQRDVY
jgi:sulfite reductase (NADPH) flavoprotein alpha-component